MKGTWQIIVVNKFNQKDPYIFLGTFTALCWCFLPFLNDTPAAVCIVLLLSAAANREWHSLTARHTEAALSTLALVAVSQVPSVSLKSQLLHSWLLKLRKSFKPTVPKLSQLKVPNMSAPPHLYVSHIMCNSKIILHVCRRVLELHDSLPVWETPL